MTTQGNVPPFPKLSAFAEFWSWLGPLAGAMGIGIQMAFALPLFGVEPGTSIRPIGWACLSAEVAFWTAAAGFPLSLSALVLPWKLPFRTRLRRSGLGMFLSILPLPVAILMLHGAAAICGFGLSP